MCEKCEKAWIKYEKINASALAEYRKIRDSAEAKHDKTIIFSWAEYEKIRDSAEAEYDKITEKCKNKG